MNAIRNWWGSSTGPKDSSDDRSTGGLYNPTAVGGVVSDRVDYNPWSGETPLTKAAVTIIEGAFVTGRSIHLSLSVIGPAQSMRVSESTSFPVNFEPYATQKEWMLSSGDGPKLLAVQFQASDGSVSDVVVASTYLEEGPPSSKISLGTDKPLRAGRYEVTMTVSETLMSAPQLSIEYSNGSSQVVTLQSVTPIRYTGSIDISSLSPNGLARFRFLGRYGGLKRNGDYAR